MPVFSGGEKVGISYSVSARDTPSLCSSLSLLDPMGGGCPLSYAPHVHPSCSLTLEWNNLGTWDEAFATFCGALAANGALRQLDLRNNQINHKGAEELALALKSNASLQQLGEAASAGLPHPQGRQGGLASQPSQCFLCPLPEGRGW